MCIEASRFGNLSPDTGLDRRPEKPLKTVAQVAQKAIEPSYNHSFHTNLLSAASTSIALAGAAAGVAQSFGVTSASTPDIMNVRKYCLVLTGASDAYMGLKMYESAKKVNSVWDKFKGVSRIGEGVADVINGLIEGTFQVLETASIKMNTNAVSALNYVGSALFSFSAFSSLFKLAIDLKYTIKIKKGLAKAETFDQKNEFLNAYLKKEDTAYRLGSLIGNELLGDIKAGVSLEKIEKVIATLVKKENELATSSVILSVFLGVIILGNIFTAGLASQIIAITRLGLMSTFFYANIKDLIESKDKPTETKIDQLMKVAVNLVSTALAVTAIVAASVGSGGALPIAVFVIGASFSIFNLVMENREFLRYLIKGQKDSRIRDDSSVAIDQSPKESEDVKRNAIIDGLIERLEAQLKSLEVKKAEANKNLEKNLARELPGDQYKKIRRKLKLNTIKDFDIEREQIIAKIAEMRAKKA